ncbi:IS630 family transposase ISRj1 [subsurface metagenome]
MSRIAPQIVLSPEERQILESWFRSGKTEQRMSFRAKMILKAAEGLENQQIAAQLNTRSATVWKWRTRFHAERLLGLQDAPRRGADPKYDKQTERRILAMLDQPPPKGYATWTGPLLARALGDVSKAHVWRVLRQHNISLARRRSWCISTDPEFAPKAAAIVGLYLDPPENAVVLCVDEKPGIQALERAQGWLRLPNGKALTGFSHDYKRHGTTTLFAALETATGLVKVGHYGRRRRREFLDFMNQVVADYEDQDIHVILDNLKTHKPKEDRWLKRHPNVHFHFTPTHASWLNQVETWFSLLWRGALRGASFTSPRQLRQAIDRFIQAYNASAMPFEWTATEVHQSVPKYNYAHLCK